MVTYCADENDTNVFTSDWAFFDTMIVASIDKEC